MKDDKVPAPPRHGPGPRISEKPQNFKKSIKILLENYRYNCSRNDDWKNKF